MEYSVEALAQLSKVTVRTLHYYDEIGLLKPLVRMQNGRRYYGTEQLLRLQEILYFKEVGFSLKKIKSILVTRNLNKSAVLSVQKSILVKEIARLEKLVKSIDKTINHYKECKMTTQEISKQFEDLQSKVKEYEIICEKNFGKEVVEDAREKANALTKEEIGELAERSKNMLNKLVVAINNHLAEDCDEVQAIMQEHYELSTIFQPMSKEMYLTSMSWLQKGSDFCQIYENIHPEMPEYLYKAMAIYASHAFPD